MFHICFCTNEPYARYTATVITSIIHSTDISKQFSDFFASIDSMGGGIAIHIYTTIPHYI